MTGAAGDAAARAHAEEIARGHDENFPVAFMLAPRDVRADMRTIYAYCRVTDDIGDAGDATRDARVAMLDAWEDDLLRCWGGAPNDPVLLALQGVVRRRRLDPEPFRALIEANRMDQRISRWQTHDDLIEYCRHSAIPVGRMVLGVLGIHDPAANTSPMPHARAFSSSTSGRTSAAISTIAIVCTCPPRTWRSSV